MVLGGETHVQKILMKYWTQDGHSLLISEAASCLLHELDKSEIDVWPTDAEDQPYYLYYGERRIGIPEHDVDDVLTAASNTESKTNKSSVFRKFLNTFG